MKLRIINNGGEVSDTKVITENGEDISDCITGIEIHIHPSGWVEADMRMYINSIDIDSDARITFSDLAELAKKHGYGLIKL